MMGILPPVVFGLVAIHAFFTAGKSGDRPGDRKRREICFLQQVSWNGENDDEGCDESGYFPAFHKIYHRDYKVHINRDYLNVFLIPYTLNLIPFT
jgi:hypothetical protein